MKITSLVGEPYKVCGVWHQEVRQEGISGTYILLQSEVALRLALQKLTNNYEPKIEEIMDLVNDYSRECEKENQID